MRSRPGANAWLQPKIRCGHVVDGREFSVKDIAPGGKFTSGHALAEKREQE